MENKIDRNFSKFNYHNVKCYVCGSDDMEVIYDIKDKYKEGSITFVKCKHDGLIFQNPCPTPESLEAFFNSSSFSSQKNTKNADELVGYFDYLSGEEFRYRMSKERLVFLNKMFDNKKPLDILKIAPGTGIFLKLAKDDGHNETGIDISEFFVNYAREKHDINMIHSAFEEYDFGEKKYDAILLFGAILNFHDPRGTLEKVFSLLKPDGQLHINYNDSNNWFYKIQKQNHFLIRPPVIAYFNEKNFEQFLKSIGFEIISHKKEIQHTHMAKLAHFSKVKPLISLMNLFGLQNKILRIPVPGAKYVVAKKQQNNVF